MRVDWIFDPPLPNRILTGERVPSWNERRWISVVELQVIVFLLLGSWSIRSRTGRRRAPNGNPGHGATVQEAVAVVAGFRDVAVMRKAVEQRRGHLRIAEHGTCGPLGEVEV